MFPDLMCRKTQSTCVRLMLPTMDYKRLLLRLPEECPHCRQSGGIQPQHTITGVLVILSWRCGRCEAEWPVTPDEQTLIERRTGLPDLRPEPRVERRKG